MSEEAIYKLHRYPSGELEEFEYVQELIRCKECKHKEEYPCKVYHDDDWYCADGERREP